MMRVWGGCAGEKAVRFAGSLAFGENEPLEVKERRLPTMPRGTPHQIEVYQPAAGCGQDSREAVGVRL